MPEVTRRQIWALVGLSHLGDLMFHKKTLHGDVMHERMCCPDKAVNHQVPIAAAS